MNASVKVLCLDSVFLVVGGMLRRLLQFHVHASAEFSLGQISHVDLLRCRNHSCGVLGTRELQWQSVV